jgi:hypothetical protein
VPLASASERRYEQDQQNSRQHDSPFDAHHDSEDARDSDVFSASDACGRPPPPAHRADHKRKAEQHEQGRYLWERELGQHLVTYRATAARWIVLRVALIADEVFAAAKRSCLAARLGFELRGFSALVLAAPSLPPSSHRRQPRHEMRIRPTCEGDNARSFHGSEQAAGLSGTVPKVSP